MCINFLMIFQIILFGILVNLRKFNPPFFVFQVNFEIRATKLLLTPFPLSFSRGLKFSWTSQLGATGITDANR